MKTYEVLKQAQEDLTYLDRLTKSEFKELLFPKALSYYFEPKWTLFIESPMKFIWSCSVDKLKLMANYIDDCKNDNC